MNRTIVDLQLTISAKPEAERMLWTVSGCGWTVETTEPLLLEGEELDQHGTSELGHMGHAISQWYEEISLDHHSYNHSETTAKGITCPICSGMLPDMSY